MPASHGQIRSCPVSPLFPEKHPLGTMLLIRFKQQIGQLVWFVLFDDRHRVLLPEGPFINYIKNNRNPEAGLRLSLAEKPGFEPGLRLTHTTPLAGYQKH